MNESDATHINRSLLDDILSGDPSYIEAAAAAGAKYIRSRIRRGPEPVTVLKVARLFAELVAENSCYEDLEMIDTLNQQDANKEVCHSHDVCDANVCMQLAILNVTGIDAADHVPAVNDPVQQLWQDAWDTAKRIGFRRLNSVRGKPDEPPDGIQVKRNGQLSTKVTLPGLAPAEEHPLEVCLDYWGRAPHLQVLCYNHDDEQGEPKVVVRYNNDGKVVEVIAGDTTLIRDHTGEFVARPYANTDDTPWEIERDANPPCLEGDKLQMPSGLTATVMHLQDRYDGDIEAFRAYDRLYGILERLDGYPASDPRHQVYNDIEQAWEVNPLTAGTVEPGDFSFVPSQPLPTTDGHQSR